MPDTKKFGNISKEDMNQMAEEKTEATKSNRQQSNSGDTQTDTSSQEDRQAQEQNESAQQNQNNSGETEADATQDSEELVKYVKETFGVPEDEIEESHLKIAKSAKESQREFNRFYNNEFQPVKKKAEAFENYDQFLQQNPDILEQIESRAKGNNENPSQNESRKVNSNQQGKLDDDLDVDEKTLVQQGYVDQSELDQMDDLARERKLLRAEAKYIRDQERERLRNDIRSVKEEEEQKFQEQQRKQQLKQKYNKSFDNFLNEYPQVDFSKPEFNQHLDKINEMTTRLIDVEDDPFKTSAEIVLNRAGKLPQQNQPQQNNMEQAQQKLDSGVNMNKGRKQSKQKKMNPVDKAVEQKKKQLQNVRKSRKFNQN